jgi:hypothetical protein
MVSALEVLDTIKNSLKEADLKIKENGRVDDNSVTIVEDYTSRKSGSNVTEDNYIKLKASNGQTNLPTERPASDYLIKSNNDFERKLKIKSTKPTSSLSKKFTPFIDKKDKKVNGFNLAY